MQNLFIDKVYDKFMYMYYNILHILRMKRVLGFKKD